MIMVVAVVLPFSVTLDMAAHEEEEEDGDETVMMRQTFFLCLWLQTLACRICCVDLIVDS